MIKHHHPIKKMNYRGFNFCQMTVPARVHGQPPQNAYVLLVESDHPLPVFSSVADCQLYIDDMIDGNWVGG